MTTKQYLKSAIEALLFLHHKPLPLARIRNSIDETIEMGEYKDAMKALVADYEARDRGMELANVAQGFQLRTKLEHRDLIRRLKEVPSARMSQAMLEVLSIVVFYQPVTREKVESVRGVECGHHLRNLMHKKLIKLTSRSDAPGRPMLYGTTKEFLELFGLAKLDDMPSLREIEELLPDNEVGAREDEEARISQELRGIVDEVEELEFNEIEEKERRFFESTKEIGTENAEKKNTEAEDGYGSTTKKRTSTQNPQTSGVSHQPDEIAGAVAFGSIQPKQEKQWPMDKSAKASSTEDGGGTPPEDFSELGGFQPKEGRRVDPDGPGEG